MRCEACGYPLQGLETSDHCPECGRPVAASLPSARPGTPWQHRPSLSSWARTLWAVTRHPAHTFSSLRITPVLPRTFLLVNLFLASFLLVDPWSGVLVGDPARAAYSLPLPFNYLLRAAVLAAQVALVAILPYILCLAAEGFMRLRGVHPTTARHICTLASCIFIPAAALPLLGLALSYTLHRFGGPSVAAFMGRTLHLSPTSPPIAVSTIIAAATISLGFAIGAWITFARFRTGFITCRYALPVNHVQFESH
jgi:hypothetical protein